jgi:hypothetical protein
MPIERALIMACSQTKRHVVTPKPAFEVYDGPSWRTYRKCQDKLDKPNDPMQHRIPWVVVLSALHGFIHTGTPIVTYERKLDAARARMLSRMPHYLGQLRWNMGLEAPIPEVYLHGSELYRRTARDALTAIEYRGRVVEPADASSQGALLKSLRQWMLANTPFARVPVERVELEAATEEAA